MAGGIRCAGYDLQYPGRDDRWRARRRFADVRAGLERDIEPCAARAFGGLRQRIDLRVRLAGAMVIAFADDNAVAHDDRADGGIGSGIADCACGEFARARQKEFVELG
jgi:hypothetical protein